MTAPGSAPVSAVDPKRILGCGAGVPGATFLQTDMTTLDLPPGSVDAVVAKKNRALVRQAGFELLEAVVHEEPEDRHAALFLWVVARRPAVDAVDG